MHTRPVFATGICLILMWPVASGASERVPADYLHEAPADWVSPHTRWAKPSATGPISVLFIGPQCGAAREIVELAQRLDITYRVALLAAANLIGREDVESATLLGTSPAERLADLGAKLDNTYDAIILGNVQFGMLPGQVRYRIVQKVADGTGLLITYRYPEDTAFLVKPLTQDADRITNGLTWQWMPYFYQGAFGKKHKPKTYDDVVRHLVSTYAVGRGRVAVLDYLDNHTAHYGGHSLTPVWPCGQTGTREYDQYQSLVAKALRWVVPRRLPKVYLGPVERIYRIARDKLPGPAVTLPVVNEGRTPAAVEVRWLVRAHDSHEWARGHTTWTVKPGRSVLTLSLPKLPRGGHEVSVWLADRRGVLDWASTLVGVECPFRVSELKTNGYHFGPGDTYSGQITVEGPLPAGARWVLELEDAWGRAFARQTHDARTRQPVRFAFKLDHMLDRWFRLQACLMAGNDVLDRHARRSYFRAPQGDRFLHMVWGGYNRDGWMQHLQCRRLAETGFNAVLSTPRWHQLSTFNRNHLAPFPYVLRLAQVPMGSQAYVDKMLKRAGGMASRFGIYGMWTWSLGDENRIQWRGPLTDWDVQRYRRFLTERYKTVKQLNAVWGTTYKQFSEIQPLNRWGPAPNWPRNHDRLCFVEHEYAWMHAACAAEIKKSRPNARVGAEGSDSGDLPTTIRDLEVWAPYADRRTDALLMSIAWDKMRGNWWGGYRLGHGGRDGTAEWLWRQFARGAANASLYFAASGTDGFLGGGLQYAADFKRGLADLRRATALAGPLVKACRLADDGVAILYTRASEHAALVHGPFGEPKKAQARLQQVLSGLGITFRYVLGEQVAAGQLVKDKVRLLFVATQQALSSAEVRGIRQFVESGGTVVADVAPGILDEHLRVRTDPAVAELFGVTPGRPFQPTKQPVKTGVRLGGRTVQLDVPLANTDRSVDALARVHPVSKGRAVLLNIGFDPALHPAQAQAYALIDAVLAVAGVQRRFRTNCPEKVAMRRFTAGGVEYLGVITRPKDVQSVNYENVGREPKLEPSDKDVIRLDRAYDVTDLRDGESMGRVDRLPAARPPYRTHIYALHARLPRAVVATGPKQAKPGQVVRLAVKLDGVDNARRVVQVRALDPAGAEQLAYRFCVTLGADGGTYTLPLAFNDPPGKWQIRMLDIASGLCTDHELEVKP